VPVGLWPAQPGNRTSRSQGGIEDLEHQRRAEAAEQGFAAFQAAQLGTLDVHLDHVAALDAGRVKEGVESRRGHQLHAVKLHAVIGKAGPQRVVPGMSRLGNPEGRHARLVRDRHGVLFHVGQPVERNIGREPGELARARLEGDDPALLPDAPRGE